MCKKPQYCKQKHPGEPGRKIVVIHWLGFLRELRGFENVVCQLRFDEKLSKDSTGDTSSKGMRETHVMPEWGNNILMSIEPQYAGGVMKVSHMKWQWFGNNVSKLKQLQCDSLESATHCERDLWNYMLWEGVCWVYEHGLCVAKKNGRHYEISLGAKEVCIGNWSKVAWKEISGWKPDFKKLKSWVGDGGLECRVTSTSTKRAFVLVQYAWVNQMEQVVWPPSIHYIC